MKQIQPMLLKAKLWFDQRTLREQWLMSLILLSGFLWFSFEEISTLGDSFRKSRVASADFQNQQLWLDQESSIDQRMLTALGKLDSTKTYSVNQLLEVMDKIARDVGLQTSITRPTTRKGKVFTEHVLLVPLSRADMRTLIDFENKIKTYYPYLGIDYMLIEPEPSAPELLRGEVRVTSFELNN